MAGVGQEGQRVGQDRADDLDHEKHRDYGDGDDEPGAVGHPGGVVMPGVLVVCHLLNGKRRARTRLGVRA
ncbi:hypothetical protein GCM10010979_01460 [Conyzicola nivalis]|uniref:Uncharacterized protein n=1 Tax=Conyzicola nivalis TaxID=1477021 RepID=A0A916S9K5_9MICO|nr:hypothetical protein GCM10010979_01460 [Conyzicola nivalis]